MNIHPTYLDLKKKKLRSNFYIMKNINKHENLYNQKKKKNYIL